ncbi:hypothetical protein GH714_020897 [Hevea brasiliensis]|uniref:WEB family protein n=1 Tax=Hevea brasiliensis TaxID=3981 RepID=A0A6A6M438_HEVBR|nr:hypothetical protein GH714_020897 [Hevea brasiliensis]
MLDDAKHEIDLLKNNILESKNEFQNSKTEWEQKEQNLMNRVKKSEEEHSSLEREIDRLVNLLRQTEEEACATKEEEAQLKDSLKEVEAEVISLQEALGESNVEGMKLKKSLLDKENELQNLFQENEELRTREAISLKKTVPMVAAKVENVNGKPKEDETKEKENDSVEVEFKMWESCKIEKKEFSPEREPEQESFEDEVDSKAEGVENFDQINGLSSTENGDGESSPSKQQQQKKKKPLFRKFGSLLEKGTSNQK